MNHEADETQVVIGVCVWSADTQLCRVEWRWTCLNLVIVVLAGLLVLLRVPAYHQLWLRQRVFVNIEDVCLVHLVAVL